MVFDSKWGEGLAGEKDSVTRDKVKCFARDK